MTLDRLETLEPTIHGVLTHAAMFRQWLSDGDSTGIVREEYDGLCAMLTQVFMELCAGIRTLTEEVDGLWADCDVTQARLTKIQREQAEPSYWPRA